METPVFKKERVIALVREEMEKAPTLCVRASQCGDIRLLELGRKRIPDDRFLSYALSSKAGFAECAFHGLIFEFVI